MVATNFMAKLVIFNYQLHHQLEMLEEMILSRAWNSLVSPYSYELLIHYSFIYVFCVVNNGDCLLQIGLFRILALKAFLHRRHSQK